MMLFQALLAHTLAAGIAGIFAQWHIAAWKLTTESIDSPHPIVRWIYRYLVFSFWFLLSFLLVSPLTAWQLLNLPAFASIARDHPWTLFLITAPAAAALYYFDRKLKIRFDKAKVAAREKLRAKLFPRARM